MKVLFLGDVVGQTGCVAIKNLLNIIKNENIDFSVVNGENAADDGVGITQNVLTSFVSGVDGQVETTYGIKKKLTNLLKRTRLLHR